jgi:hypothetical protein
MFELAPSAGVTVMLAISVADDILAPAASTAPPIDATEGAPNACVALPCVEVKVAGLNFLKYK